MKQAEENKVDVDCHEKFLKRNKLILKSQQRFKSKKHIMFTEEVNKIALNASIDKRIKSIDSMESYGHETSKI